MGEPVQTVVSAPDDSPRRPQARWISGAQTDVMMAFSWMPFTLLALALQSSPDALLTLMLAVFLFSFTHQPLTLLLVYGDQSRFALRPQIFKWSPLIFAIAILVFMKVSPLLLAIVAGLWNAEHTLMQRYGITRIYGRKVGQNSGGVEIYMFFSWLILVVLYAAVDPELLDKAANLGFKGPNMTIMEMLTKLAPGAELLLPAAIVAVAGLAIVWLFQEFRRPSNSAKLLYVLSTAALFAVMLINPIAGFMGYVGAHAYEYYVIVNHNLAMQYQKPGEGGGRVGVWARGSYGRIGFFAVYASLILMVFVLRSFLPAFWIFFIAFMIGGLHFFYDGFIWKLRIPSVAKGLGASPHRQ